MPSVRQGTQTRRGIKLKGEVLKDALWDVGGTMVEQETVVGRMTACHAA